MGLVLLDLVALRGK